MKRRSFLSKSLTGGFIISSGILSIKSVLADWPSAAMHEKDISKAMKAIAGGTGSKSSNIRLKAPEVAENGAVVPITVDATSMKNVESISIFVDSNPSPLIASFAFSNGALGFASTRLKMGKSGNVTALVKAGGKVYKTTKEVKVTIGGCGG